MLKRTLFVLIGIFIISVGIEMLVIFQVSNKGVEEYQELALTQKQEVMELYLETEYSNLEALSSSHAIWTEANDYVTSGDSVWLDENIVTYLVDGDFNVDFAVASDETDILVSNGIDSEIIVNNVMYNDVIDNDEPGCTILEYNGEIYLMSGYPFSNDDESNQQGAFITGRKLDIDSFTVYLSEFSGTSEISIQLNEDSDLLEEGYKLMTYESMDESLFVHVKYDFGFSGYIEQAITTPVLWITLVNITLIVIVILVALSQYRKELNLTLDQVKDLKVQDGLLAPLKLTKSPEMNEVINVLNDMISKVDESIEELMRKNIEVVKLLSTAAEINDEYTSKHSSNVCDMSIKIAKELGMKEIGKLELSAQLHDIGKVFIQHSLLNKKGKITPQEYEEMKKHSINGARLLNNITKFEEIKLGVLHHHEKWDGSGYPSGLMGQEIPLYARIISVADVYDALTSKRPYREPFDKEKALKIMKEGRGKHFDPKILDVFLNLIKKEKIQ